MTEKEKMLCGELYDTRDLELRHLSSSTKDLMRVYNSLPAENMDLRNQIIRLMFGSCSENVRGQSADLGGLRLQYFSRRKQPY